MNKKNVFFFREDFDPIQLYKIKNIFSRKKLLVEVKGFIKGEEWNFFVNNFNNLHEKELNQFNLKIDPDSNLCILLIIDFSANSKIIETDVEKITNILIGEE